MKIIQALKKIKQLDRKINKASRRVEEWSSYMEDPENPIKPLYDEATIKTMMQQIHDWVIEKTIIRHRLHKTNVATTADFKGKSFTIDELLCMQNITIPGLISAQKCLSRKEPQMSTYQSRNSSKMRLVTQFDSLQREKELDKLENDSNNLSDLLDILTLETEVLEAE